MVLYLSIKAIMERRSNLATNAKGVGLFHTHMVGLCRAGGSPCAQFEGHLDQSCSCMSCMMRDWWVRTAKQHNKHIGLVQGLLVRGYIFFFVYVHQCSRHQDDHPVACQLLLLYCPCYLFFTSSNTYNDSSSTQQSAE